MIVNQIQSRYSSDSVKILFWLGVVGGSGWAGSGKIITRIRQTSAKDLLEVEAELGKISFELLKKKNILVQQILN